MATQLGVSQVATPFGAVGSRVAAYRVGDAKWHFIFDSNVGGTANGQRWNSWDGTTLGTEANVDGAGTFSSTGNLAPRALLSDSLNNALHYVADTWSSSNYYAQLAAGATSWSTGAAFRANAWDGPVGHITTVSAHVYLHMASHWDAGNPTAANSSDLFITRIEDPTTASTGAAFVQDYDLQTTGNFPHAQSVVLDGPVSGKFLVAFVDGSATPQLMCLTESETVFPGTNPTVVSGVGLTTILAHTGLSTDIVGLVDTQATPLFHLIYHLVGTGWLEATSTDGATWQAGLALPQIADSDTHPTLTLDANGGLHLFYCRFNAASDYGIGHLAKTSGGAWTAQADVVAHNATNRQYTVASRTDGATHILLAWVEGTAAPYSVMGQLVSTSITSGPPAATAYTFSGPGTGPVAGSSTPFTVKVSPTGSAATSTTTITPSDGGAGGTFAPATVALTGGVVDASAALTYTAASAGAKTLSVTASPVLGTNPASITYTAVTTTVVGGSSFPRLWLKPSSLNLSDGAAVASWTDSAGYGLSFTQATGSQQPLYKANPLGNNVPMLSFASAANQVLSGALSFEPQSFFLVVAGTDAFHDHAALGLHTTGSTYGDAWHVKPCAFSGHLEHARGLVADGTATPALLSAWSACVGGFHVVAGRINGNVIELYVDGALVSSTTASGARLSTDGPLAIGARYVSGALGDYWAGYLGDVVLWDHAISSGEMQQMWQYFSHRYLDSSTLYSPPAPPALGPYILSTFRNYTPPMAGSAGAEEERLVVLTSPDGITWSAVTQDPWPGYTAWAPDKATVRDACILLHTDGNYYCCFTECSYGSTGGVPAVFGIARSTDGCRTWSRIAEPSTAAVFASPTQVWAPKFFVDFDGTVYIAGQTSNSNDTSNTFYVMRALDSTLANWTAATALTVTGIPNGGNAIDGTVTRKAGDGAYYLWYKNENAAPDGQKYIEVAQSQAGIYGPYTVIRSGNWAGWGGGSEGPCPILLADGVTWRVYMDQYGTGQGLAYAESKDGWATWTPRANIVGPAGFGTLRHGKVIANLPGGPKIGQFFTQYRAHVTALSGGMAG